MNSRALESALDSHFDRVAARYYDDSYGETELDDDVDPDDLDSHLDED